MTEQRQKKYHIKKVANKVSGNDKLFGIIERGDLIRRRTPNRDNPVSIAATIDELNQNNPDTDLSRNYLTLDDLGKGERLVFAVNRLALMLERSRIGDYVTMMSDSKGFLWKNLLAGIYRGIGTAIGFFLLSALALYILNAVADWGIPFIADFVSEILRYMQEIKNVKI